MKILSCAIFCVILIAANAAPNVKGTKGTRYGKQEQQPRVGCPPRCVCGQNGINGEFTINCDKFPKTALPSGYNVFQAKESPNNLTRESLIPLRPTAITTLDLCNSGIEDIADGALPVFPRLTKLKLSFNHIHQIKVNAFMGCNLLKEIYLDGNGLTTLGNGCFSKVPNLQVLHLHHNQIKHLPPLPPSLNSLDISHNDIADVGNFSFQENIKNVDICNNPLKEIPTACFAKALKLNSLCVPNLPPLPIPSSQRDQQGGANPQPLTQVQNLTLTAPITGTDLPSEVMKDVEKMTNLLYFAIVGFNIHTLHFIREHSLLKLKLNNVALTGPEQQVRKDFLMSLASQEILQDLDLSNSPQLAGIVVDNADIWTNFQNIHYINFHNCRLTSIGHVQGSTFVHAKSAKPLFVDLSMNPLHCDCALAAKLTEADIRLVGDLTTTLCSAPDALRGKPLSHVITQCNEAQNGTSAEIPVNPAIVYPNEEHPPSESELGEKNPNPDDDFGKAPNPGNHEDKPNLEEEHHTNDFEDIPPQDSSAEVNKDSNDNNDEIVLKGNNNFPQAQGEHVHEHKDGGQASAHLQTDYDEIHSQEHKETKHEPKEEEEVEEPVHNTEDYVFLDGETHHHFADKEHEKTTYIIVGVIIVVAAIGAILFSVLFFYFRRRGHAGIEGGNALFRKHASSKDNLVK